MARRARCYVLLAAALIAMGLVACAQPAPTPTAGPTATAAPAAPTPVPATPAAAPSPTSPPPTPTTALPTATPQPTAPAKPTAAAAAPAPTPTPLSLDQLSAIQPGLGTVMIEYGRRTAALWFAGHAGNWDMAAYQLDEMREIQEVGEMTRPARAPALKAFESGFLDPLEKAIEAKDKTQFETAYKATLQGCNSCHGASTSSAFKQGYKFVKVQVPRESIWDIYDWKGQ